jgi:pimeloyl-ACP methyl ester carboxylesterase
VEKATIVGHDTGGGVALIMGIEHPDRVSRLVLTNVVAYDSWPIDDMIALGNPNWRSKSPKEVADFVAGGLPDGLHNADRLTDEFREGIVAPYSDELGKISLIRNASALNTNHTTMLIDRHKDIKAPTLVLWGVHDPWQTIRDGENLAREIPSAELAGSRMHRTGCSRTRPSRSPAQFSRSCDRRRSDLATANRPKRCVVRSRSGRRARSRACSRWS